MSKEITPVGPAIQQDSIRPITVTTSTTSLLKVSLEGIRTIHVNDNPNIRLVDTHAKGICCHHNANLIMLPVLLSLILYSEIKSGMIESSGNAI